MYGIDVSNNNASVDWSGVEFVFIKATESTTFIDRLYPQYRDEAKSRGILWAPYHFAHPDKNSAADEARHFLSHSDPSPMPCALDFETRPGYNPLAIMGTSAAVQWCLEFAAAIEAASRPTPYLYTFRSYADALYPRLPSLPKWLANGKGYPLYKVYAGSTIAIEQYSSAGGLDRNTSYLPLTPSPSPSPGDDDMPAHLVLLDDGEVVAFPSCGAAPYMVQNPTVLNIGLLTGFFDRDPRPYPPSSAEESAEIRAALLNVHGSPAPGTGTGTPAPTHFRGTGTIDLDINAV